MKPNLLALETSTNICDVSLITTTNQNVKIYNKSNDTTAKHAEFLFELIEETLSLANLSRSQIDAVVFGQGPGGFTGLRVACGVAQGIAYALDIPVVAVPSLMTIALQAQESMAASLADKKCCHIVIQDARMNELYVAAYKATNTHNDNNFENNIDIFDGKLTEKQAPMLIDIKDINVWVSEILSKLDANTTVLISGDALLLDKNIGIELQNLSEQIIIGQPLKAGANALAVLGLQFFKQGKTIKPEYAAPLYVRDKVAFTINERKAGASGNPSANQQT